ncbi:PQQ-dependent sugar dehydrogenase [Nocardia cyriacigeorgica]|uniref:Quinoprotein glucose dehydrogenase B n=1 Tax=Nocardia cyriacigeorgica TaxID=135487 RepID=A0A4U8VX67_9NOCA|nr:PQQ-dependent sugar dehydrogenase [Nocardia cyriacigeorgica]VFA97265.1 Quinoprotein glucose dehydrogenase B precursor [Nocardia cyriacigeorgica]
MRTRPEIAPFHTRATHVRARAIAAAVLLVCGLAACGDETSEPPGAPPPPLATTTEASRPAGAPDLAAGEEVVRDIETPWGLDFLPDGAALVSERDTGRIVRVVPGAPAEQVYEVAGVVPGGEGGLLGIAASPRYAEDRYVYAYFTAASDNRIVRFRLGEPSQVVFDGIAKAGNHNGGRIAFGPDGMLYVGTGDAGRRAASQDPGSPNGKILRLTPDGGPAPGNPRPDSPVYSLGHRNVQGLAWDSAGRLFAAEFGQNDVDEINLIEPGRNYGWPEVEGTGGADRGFTDPLVTWSTDEASPSGIAITANTLYAAALRGERLWTVPLTATGTGAPADHFRDGYGRLRTVLVAPDGALWLTTSNTDGRGDIRAGDDRIVRFPAR